MNHRVALARGATAPMAPLLRSRETGVDPVVIVCPEMALVGNTASFGSCPLAQALGRGSMLWGIWCQRNLKLTNV